MYNASFFTETYYILEYTCQLMGTGQLCAGQRLRTIFFLSDAMFNYHAYKIFMLLNDFGKKYIAFIS